MKILHLNTDDIFGGAANAAFRLNYGLRQISVDSKMLVQAKKSDNIHVYGPDSKLNRVWSKIRPALDILPLQLCRRKNKTIYHIQWFPGSPLKNISLVNPDIIHLHWICDGFIRIEALKKIKKPVVWTLHDMWAFTGGCNYSEGCERYKSSCGKCPQLSSLKERDFSRWVWHRKYKAWQNLNPTIVTPSRWLAECVKESSLFYNKKIEVIPNGINLQNFKPMDKSIARELLNLPKRKKFVLFGAIKATGDTRKGFQYLKPLFQKLKENSLSKDIEIIVFGSSEPKNAPNFGVPIHYMGRLHDEISLNIAYNVADVFVLPSLQENLPNTGLEAMACGTPCVAFNIGGMSDLIEHKKTGYLAKPYESEDLARGIAWVLENEGRYQKLSSNARKKAEQEFGMELQAQRFVMLYKELLGFKTG